MKDIRFKRIVLNNFKAQSRVLELNGENVEITGRNETGKSTICNAISWVLTGYDMLDRSNHRLFNDKVEPTYDNSCPAIVELSLDIDGTEYSIKREARIGWTRPRQQEEYVRKGTDDYYFYIDGVKVTSGEYKSFVEKSICPIDKLKFILNIDYYKNLDWREMRGHLADIIGIVRESDYEGDFSEIFEMTKKYTIEELKERIKAQLKPINEEIDVLPSKIEALETSLPDISSLGNINEKIAEQEKIIEGIDKEMQGINDSVREYREKRRKETEEIYRLKEEVEDIVNKANLEKKKRLAEAQSELAVMERANARIMEDNEREKSRRMKIGSEIVNLEARLAIYNSEIKSYREENEKIKARVFTDDKCQYCGQVLPDDMLEELKDKFNEKKRIDHENIVRIGKAKKAQIENTEKEIESLRKLLAEEVKPLPLADPFEIKAKIASISEEEIKLDTLVGYNEKVALIAQKEARMTIIPTIDTSEYTERKNKALAEIRTLSEAKGTLKEHARISEKIEEMKTQLAQNVSKRAKLERYKSMIDEMERQKAEIIKNKTQYLFEVCKIEMETTKKDGSKIPSCEISIKDVSSTTTNDANKMIVGIDLSNAFCKSYDVNFPLIVDNAERMDSNNRNFHTDRQTIITRVTDNDFEVR